MADIPLTPAGNTNVHLQQIESLMTQSNTALQQAGTNATLNEVATALVNGFAQARAALLNGDVSLASDIIGNLGQLESELSEVGGNTNLVVTISTIIAQCNGLSRDVAR